MLSLLVIGALPWVLVFFYYLHRRPFTAFLVWLLIAPAVTYLVGRTPTAVLYRSSGDNIDVQNSEFYYQQQAKISLHDLLEPNRTFLGLFVVILVLRKLSNRTRWIALDTTEIWMSILSLILIASVFFRSARLAYGLRVAVDAFIVPFLAYYFTRRFVTTEDRFRQFIRIIVYMGVFVIGYCLIERATNPELFYRARGPFESGNTLHTVLTVAFFGAFLSSFGEGSFGSKKAAVPASIRRLVMSLVPVVITFTLVRGNWVGFLSGLAIFVILARRLVSGHRTLQAIGVTLICTLIAALAFKVVPVEIVERRIIEQENALGRIATWMATLHRASEAPVFGVGLNNLQGLLRTETATFRGFASYTTPHNSILSILVELGTVGLIAYLGVVMTIMRTGMRSYRKGSNLQARWRGVTVVALLISYLTPSLFANTLYVTGLIHIYVFAFAGAVGGVSATRRVTAQLYQKQENPVERPTAIRWAPQR